MFSKKKKSLITLLVAFFAAAVFALGALMLTPQQTAYAYTSSNIPKGNNVIAIHDGTKFDAAELKTLATMAGYTDLNAMMSAATESGTAIAETLKGKVVQLGVDRTVGGSALNWVPVYLSRSTDGDAILTLWLATDIYRSSWSDGTYSLDSNAPQTWNDKTIYCDTYDGSFIRHKLNGKTGWTTNWGSTSSEANPNANIGTMVSDFYGNGALASYVTAPAKVSWQKNTHKTKNDPNWNGTGSQVEGTKANYPCDWLNDNVWLPSMYEVYDSSIPNDYSSNTFTADGGLWGVSKTGDIVSSTDGAWLRSCYPSYCADPFLLVSYGNHSYGNVFRCIGVRPALHLNLSAVAEAAKPATCEFPSDWKNSVSNYSADLTEITFAKTAPDGYSDSGKTLNTNIKIYEKTGDNTKIAFVYDGTITAPQDSSELFYNKQKLTAINFDNFSTDNVTDMNSMFYYCKALTSLNLSGFNTAKVTDMYYMFDGCSALTSLNLSGFNTVNVENMNHMFAGCKALTSLDLSGFTTANVTDMRYMFDSCSKLTLLNLSGFNTAKVTNMYSMFYYCSGLTSLDLSGFNTVKVEKMSAMFYGCSGLTTLDLSDFNTANVTNMSNMFNNCSSLKTIKVSSSLATKLSTTTDNTYLYYGDRATWYDGNGGTYTNTNRFSTEGTYTTVQPPFEVTVGTAKTYYNSLAAAWNYANTQPFATVKMLADATVGETLTIDTGKNITLNLNGHKLERTDASGSVIKVNGTFTLNDSNNTTSHDITSPVTNQSVTIKGGLITGGKGYGDSVIGGAIYVDGGSFTMSGGTIAGNTADFGGGVRVDANATFIMNSGATISHNKATKDGGGICVCSATNVELKGTVSDNAAVAGGGIYYEGNGTHIISGATIKNNTVTKDGNLSYSGNGGGIYVDKCTVTMRGGTISGNSTSKNGGGVYVLNGSKFEMTNGTISGNMAGSNNYGGGVYVIGTFIMSDGAISGNKAQDGGGVCVNGGTFTMSGGTIKGNNATIYNGGGVELTDGTFNVSGGVVIKDNVKGGTLDQSTGFYTGGTKNNVYLESVKITVTSALTTGAIIGVYNSGDVATGYNQSEKPSVFFKADDSEKCASANNGTVSIGAHTGGTATCVAAKICTVCGESYGSTDSSNHTPSADDGDCTTAITCSGCGTVTTAAQTHDYANSTKYNSDGTYHWKICKNCSVENTNTKWSCSGGTATCVAKATCLTCHNEYGSVNSSNHDPAIAWSIDTENEKHYHVCNNGCGNRVNEASHIPEADDNDCTTEIKCSVCQAVTTAAQTHDFTSGYTSDGAQHWHVCAHSGCTQTDTKTNHDYNQEVANDAYLKTAATCTAKAVYYKSCVCGFVGTETFESGAPIGHDWATEFTVDKQASCTEKGSKSKHCSRCSEKTEVTEIEMTAHPYGDWQTVTAATCSAVGSKKHICSACNHEELGTIDIDPTAHSFNNWIGEVAANCTYTGTKAHKDCNLCGKHFDSDGVEITDLTIATNDNHAWNDGEVTTDPTCTDEGVKTFTCTRTGCGHTKPESVAALGHTEVTDNAVAPTCTAKGKTEGKHCSVCNMVITVQTEVAVLGHDWATEFTVDKQPTVSEKGSKSKHCSRCEEKTEITEIDMLKAELVKPDENGGEVDEVVVSIPSGFTPDIELVVTEIKEDSYAPQYEAIAESANGVIELVYDVTLKSDGVTVQPDGTLTIRLRIPENLKGKEFKLFHLHGNTATDMEYEVDGNYAVVTTDKLSEFIFVGEKALPKLDEGDSNTVWLVLIIIMAILILCEIGYAVLRKTGKIKFGGDK